MKLLSRILLFSLIGAGVGAGFVGFILLGYILSFGVPKYILGEIIGLAKGAAFMGIIIANVLGLSTSLWSETDKKRGSK